MATKTIDKAAKKSAALKAPARKPAAGASKDAASAARRSPPPAARQAPAGGKTNGKAAPKPQQKTKSAAPSKARPVAATVAKTATSPAKPKPANAKRATPASNKPPVKAPAKSTKAASAKAAATKSVDAGKSKPKSADESKKAAATKAPVKAARTEAHVKPVVGAKAAVTTKAKESKPASKTDVRKNAAHAAKSEAAPKVVNPAGAKAPIGESVAKKSGKGQSAAKTAPESPVMKKPLVGQKPRTERPASALDGIPLSFMPKAPDPVKESPVKPSPASQEAKLDFKVDDHVVYPAHGVGRIVGIERQVIAGIVNELFLIDFEQEKMKLRVPTAKAKSVGMRQLSEPAVVKKAIETLKGRARIKRTMWSRRAQEYEAKINSGDILAVAEVVRDLYRASDQPEQSYSERQLFEAALDRLAREVAAVHKSDLAAAIAELEGALQQKKAA